MKSKIFFIINILLLTSGFCYADTINFKTESINITNNGNLVNATNGLALTNDNKVEIEAKKFEYYKNLNELKAFKGKATLNEQEIEIKFGELDLNERNSIIKAQENVIVSDLKRGYSINSDSVTYDQKKGFLISNTQSTLTDKNGNKFLTQEFEYDLNQNVIKIKNATFKDVTNNIFNIELAFINTLTNKFFGKDIIATLDNQSFNRNNEPRIKGRGIVVENDSTEISKGVFTTCKKRDGCPPWELSAEKIQHNKKTKMINYKNAWLKLYDMPVVYFPKFFHPDPSVDRKSGFLVPSIKNSPNSNSFFSLPYYKVISNNKDATITPRLFSNNQFLIQTEYRQVNLNSKHTSDISFFKEKNKSSKNHFFYNLKKKLNFLDFENGQLNLKVQKTSNDTYLKANKLTSPLINQFDLLENSLNLKFSSANTKIDSELIVYEDLTRKKSDRYEFILPRIDLTQKIENKTSLDGNFTFTSNNLIKNYQTNIFEKINTNNLIFNSNPTITNRGFYNNYEFIIKNINSDTQNSSNYKEDKNIYYSGLFQINSSLPLIKENEKLQKIFSPKLSLKIAPKNNTKNISDEDNQIDAYSLFNLDRITDTIESGASLAYGADYSVLGKNDTREILNIKLANNIRFDKSEDLPKINQLGEKTSNFFNELTYSPNEVFSFKYKSSIKNNLKDINNEILSTTISLNNFVTTFDYLNENNTTNKNSYLQNDTAYNFNNSNSLNFSTRRNKKTNLTEYYNLMYQYKNDCLAASVEYNKDYYDDNDIKPEESIFFKLTIIPFGETSSPNLKN